MGDEQRPKPSYDELAALVAAQARTITQLQARIAQLETENAELRRHLGLNSTNSARPPSSDDPFIKPAPRSQRRRSGRRPGAQPGHPGANLERVADPDAVIDHRPATCAGCGHALPADAVAEGFTASQVFDLPEPRLVVTEHRMLRLRCSCGHLTCAEAPDGAGAPTQHGPGVHALAVYQGVAQHLPSERGVQACRALHGAPISEGFARTAWGGPPRP